MAGSATSTIDLGSTPDNSFSVIITDANITASSYVEAFVMVDSTVDNDTDAHKLLLMQLQGSQSRKNQL